MLSISSNLRSRYVLKPKKETKKEIKSRNISVQEPKDSYNSTKINNQSAEQKKEEKSQILCEPKIKEVNHGAGGV